MIKKLMDKQSPPWKIWVRKRWKVLSLILFSLIIFFLLSPVIFRPWIKYPPALKAEIAWRGFIKTFEGPCREACLVNRQTYADTWRTYFSKHKEEAYDYYSKALPVAPIELQAALIRIMAAEQGGTALPQVLEQMIADETVSPGIKKLIVSSFPEAFSDEDWQSNLRVIASDPSTEISDRAYALGLLSSFPDADNAPLMKELIINGREPELTASALDAVSLWPEGSLYWSDDDLHALVEAVKREDGAIRWRRIWLFAGLGKGETIRKALESIASDETLDNISRGLAAEALRSAGYDYPITPEPTEAEWQEYYEKI